ncbi:MAG: hypothetical protein KF833_17535 [Verrucomicrobiae bacterium]|nr:hypothetical protein [Verrucomicrobiae bacterium]
MNTLRRSSVPILSHAGLAVLAGFTLLAAPAGSPHADLHGQGKARMTINAGTVFNLDASGPLPWNHEVRGVLQVSNLGNCRGHFAITISAGTGGRAFDLAGTMTLTTLAGDKLVASVVGWADPDPNDLKPAPTTFILHYDATITGGTGALTGARGHGRIDGAFIFSGPDGPDDTDPTDDRFCEGYAGVATWLYEGVLILPRGRR